MALDLRQNLVSAKYLENKLTDFAKFYDCIHFDKNKVELLPVVCFFTYLSHGHCQNFVPAQCLLFFLLIFRTWPLYYIKSHAAGL